MATSDNRKRIVVSFHNLPPDIQDGVKASYPLGCADAMKRVDKPNGDFFYAVPYETDDVSYLVKIDVKIDDLSEDEDDKDFYDEDIKGADDIQDDGGDDDEPAEETSDFDESNM